MGQHNCGDKKTPPASRQRHHKGTTAGNSVFCCFNLRSSSTRAGSTEKGNMPVGWRSDLNADLWSEVVLFLDPADHAELRSVSVELRDTIAFHYINELLLEAEGAGRDGTRFPLACSFRTAALIDLPFVPPCGIPSWGAYFTLVGGRDALLDEIWRRPLFERAVVLVAALEGYEASWHPHGLEGWQRVALTHCIGGRAIRLSAPIAQSDLFQLVCGDAYCHALQIDDEDLGSAKFIVCVSQEDLAPASAVARIMQTVLSFSLWVSPIIPFHYSLPYGATTDDNACCITLPRLHSISIALDWLNDEKPRPNGLLSLHLLGNSSLQFIEFRCLCGISKIGPHFLLNSMFLEKVKFFDLPGIQSIGVSFLGSSSMLTEIVFLGFPSLKTIGNFFLNSGKRLQTLQFPPLPNLVTIGGSFLGECSSLKTVIFGDLPALTCIGGHFLSTCPKLQSVELPELPSLTEIGISFMHGCASLTQISFVGLPALKLINRKFMTGCTQLRCAQFHRLESLEEIGFGFFEGCTMLLELSLGELPSLKCIRGGFLRGCIQLRSVKFQAALSSLEEIGSGFLAQCRLLAELALPAVPRLASIGSSFLGGAVNLSHVDFSLLEGVATVGDGACEGCGEALQLAAQRWLASRR